MPGGLVPAMAAAGGQAAAAAGTNPCSSSARHHHLHQPLLAVSRRRHVAKGFRGARMLLGRMPQEEPQPQLAQQQQQQLLETAPPAVAKALSFLGRVGSGSTDSQPAQDQQQQSQQQDEQQQEQPDPVAMPADYLSLLFVSLLWGSYAPALRYLYSMDGLLTPQVLTAHRTVISATALIIASAATFAVDRFQQHRRLQEQLREEALQREREEQLRKQWLRILPTLLLNMLAPFGSSSTTTSSRGHSSKQQPLFPFLLRPDGRSSSSSGVGGGDAADSGIAPLLRLLPRIPGMQSATTAPDSNSSSPSGTSSTTSSTTSSSLGPVLVAGLELGTWNFLATAAQACGLSLSTATKAAFLTQTTAVFTPCLAMLCGQAVLPSHWVACLAALLGSFCITLDSVGVSAGDGGSSIPAALASSAQQRQQQEVVAEAPVQPSAAAAAPVSEVLEAPPVLASAAGDVVGVDSSSSSYSDSSVALQAGAAASADASAAQSSVDSSLDAGGASAAAVGGVDSSPASLLPAARYQQQLQDRQLLLSQSAEWAQEDSLEADQQLDQQQQALADAGPAALLSPVDPSADGLTAGGWEQQQQQQAAEAAGLGALSSSSMQEQEAVSSINSSSVELEQQQQDGEQQNMQGVMQLDSPNADASERTSSSTSSPDSSWGISGEVYILLACCCYAIATVRLSMLAPGLDPVQLATSKTLTLAAASLFWLLAFGTGAEGVVAADAAADSQGGAAAAAAAAAGGGLQHAADQVTAAVQSASAAWHLPPAFDQGQGRLLLFYSALGPGALATVLQTKGQGTVAAAQAQVFYSLTPVWAALLAVTCLQGEEMGPLAWVGGGVILAASIGAAFSPSSSSGGGSGNGGGTDQQAGSGSSSPTSSQ